jgi:hypothetical protein
LRKIGELERRGHFKSHPDQKFFSLVFSPSSPLPPPPPPFMSTVNDDKLRATFAGAADGEILKSSVAVVPFRCRTFEIGTRRCRCRRRHIMCLKTSQTTLGLTDTIVVENFINFLGLPALAKNCIYGQKRKKRSLNQILSRPLHSILYLRPQFCSMWRIWPPPTHSARPTSPTLRQGAFVLSRQAAEI